MNSQVNNQIGFVRMNNARWDIIDTTHAQERSVQRALCAENINFIVSMLVDQLDESPEMKKMVLNASSRREVFRFRDDLNDVVIVLRFDQKRHEVVVITCWNQALDRELFGRAHTSLGIGYNIHARKDTVRLIYRNKKRTNVLCQIPNLEKNPLLHSVQRIA